MKGFKMFWKTSQSYWWVDVGINTSKGKPQIRYSPYSNSHMEFVISKPFTSEKKAKKWRKKWLKGKVSL